MAKLPLFAAPLLVGALFSPLVATAQTLRVDFNDGIVTQPGWQSIDRNDDELGDSWSKVFPGGIGLDIDAFGGISLDDRDRGSANGGGAEANMWRDFLFGNGSVDPSQGVDLKFSGLNSNSSYPLTIWAFDDSSNGGRRANWDGHEVFFPDSPDPSSLNDYSVTFDIITDATGAVTVQGRTGDSAGPSHNVFINGLEIGDPISTDGPVELAISADSVAASAPIGTLVGTFITTDPTPGDSFTYTLVGGAGADHNGQFAIEGERLETDRDLSGFQGGRLLSVRARTTDTGGDWVEEVFLIEVVNDSDADGLDDTWELAYFPDLETATGDGDNDSDGLPNSAEQSADTNPTRADTDGDGLGDAAEVNTHGSDPTLADTDGDGLSDGDEVSGAGGHVTDPTKADSDGDGFNDALELAEGSDPNNGSDFPDTLLPLRLNEILARNDIGIEDGFGQNEDWIEIYNPNNQAVNLDGYYLTDTAEQPTKWNFPAVEIPANGYLLVFASGRDTSDPGGNPHTNFQLAADGEYLAIVRPDGSTVDDAFAPQFPEQFTDISYGAPPTGGAFVFFEFGTPGVANGTTPYPGVVKDTNFSVDRGFYDAPFQLSITSDTPGATIRYTTDGSLPSLAEGTIYTGPIDITTTSVVRAIAYFEGFLPTNVDTHTYIFVDDVAAQPADPAGWPNTWGSHDGFNNIPADYEMDPRVVNNTHGLGVHTVQEALLDIPTVSIAMHIDDFISDATGIYANPQFRTEKACSMEYILPDGAEGFQEDCKIETHGNASRRPARMHKHSLRLTFSSQVGTPKLRYPLFPDSPVEEFNKLVLRACFTDSWGLVSWGSSRYRPNDSQYIRDVWMKDSVKALGHPSSHGNFVHLYVNGLYFGLHNLTERIEDDFFADHLGGEREDWQINKDLSAPPARWNAMMGILNGSIEDNAVYESAKAYIDVENYADYMLLHYYADSEDWPHHNGYAAANANSGDGKFRFFVWDQEIVLDKFSWNRYSDSRGGGAPFQRLRRNAEFRILFADRVQKHLFNDGALSESASIARYLARANEIDKAIVAESARWGDVQDTVPYASTPSSSTNIDADYYPPLLNNPIYFTREQHWIVERDNVVGHYIPTLHDQGDSRSIVRELRSNNLFPSIDAPVFAQHGGVVPTGHTLGVGAPDGTIYYTLDGSDPRLVGGAINPAAGSLAGGTLLDSFIEFEADGWRYLDTGADLGDSGAPVTPGNWRHPGYDDASWGTGQAMLGYGGITGATVNTTVSWGPNQSSKFTTTYLRKSFTVAGAADYTDLEVGIKRDDGAVVYLNGVEITRSNMPGGVVSSSTVAQSSVGGSAEGAINVESYALRQGDLIEGTNVIAVELHQRAAGSSDLGLDLQIKATRPNPGASGVTLTQTGTLKARARNNGEWSALTEADFIVGTAAATDNLVVSELMYNPAGPTEDTEWIELMNISQGIIDLTGVSFVGIDYEFPAGVTLAAGERIVVVKNRTAFGAAYDIAGMNIAPGEFLTTSLANGGEELAVIAEDGSTDIRRFTYNDRAPWPTAPDGGGYSLVLIAPESSPDHALPSNWRSSAKLAGSPGGTDSMAFVGDPAADEDGDGLNAFLEHALGSVAGDAGASPESAVSVGIGLFENEMLELDEYPTIAFRRNLAADDVRFEVQVGRDLATWSSEGVIFVSAEPNGDGTETVRYRSATPVGDLAREFIRLRATSRP